MKTKLFIAALAGFMLASILGSGHERFGHRKFERGNHRVSFEHRRQFQHGERTFMWGRSFEERTINIIPVMLPEVTVTAERLG